MLQITSHRQGAILNHNHGRESSNSLLVRLEGLSDGYPVTVNGQPALMDGQMFRTDLALTQKLNTVIVAEQTPQGLFSQEIVLVWDKASFKRFDTYLDDHSFLFTDLTKERPASAFSHFYLKRLKKIHDEYGWKVTLNCFFRNDHDGSFTLDQMPDIWKSEFQDNADWLKFSFHSRSEFPDRPYIESTMEEFAQDYDDVQREIIRFAGEECFIAPEVIHWANIHPVVAAEVIRRGARVMPTSVRPCIMGGPSLAERMKGGDMSKSEKRSLSGEDKNTCNDGLAMFYEHLEEKSYLAQHRYYYDPLLNVVIRGPLACCCNLVPLNALSDKVNRELDANERSGCDIIGIASHEQYSFPYYPNYQPDHLDRLELAVRTITERGYAPVFFSQDFMGNPSWKD